MYIELVPFYQQLPPWPHFLPCRTLTLWHFPSSMLLPAHRHSYCRQVLPPQSPPGFQPWVRLRNHSLCPCTRVSSSQLEKAKQATRAPWVWSPAFSELGARGRLFPWSTPFSLLFVLSKTGPFCPQRAFLQAEVQIHLYFFSSFVRYVTLQNLLSGSPRSIRYLWNHLHVQFLDLQGLPLEC